ncbi:hypothetical protein JKF63_01279 [Porcisia hertigi]|uniref:Uncharacterized protein n=1 Tax=Porcisia hertigi TaxID=2761500 RepID=A0A836HJG2_9TRYP|nr:hypothetical protein JKF63_01279 [Porcisia hertigi]
MKHFFSMISPLSDSSDGFRPLLSHFLATGDNTSSLLCGVVDLSPWVTHAGTFTQELPLLDDSRAVHSTAPPLPVSVPSVPSTPEPVETPNNLWLLGILVLSILSFVALCADIGVLYWIVPKRRRLKERARELKLRAAEHEPA